MMETNLPPHLIFKQLLEMEYTSLENNMRFSLDAIKTNEAESENKYQRLNSESISFFNEPHPEATAGHFIKHALFISAYSYMEYSLKKFCGITTISHPQFKRRVSDFEKVHQFYFYLINDLHIKKDKVEEDWEKLNIFRDIRNSIVHYNSTIGKNISAKTYNYIREDSRIQFVEPRSFYLKNADLIMDLTTVSQRFLLTLISGYEIVISQL